MMKHPMPITRTHLLVTAGGILALALAPAPAFGQTSARSSARCRGAVASSMQKLIAAGLRTMDSCHARRDRGKFSGDCNQIASLGTNSAFARARAQAAPVIGARCAQEDPVRDNYPGRDILGFLVPEIIRVLERSGSDLQGAPVFVGDRSSVKALGRCHKAVGKGRTKIVVGMLKAAAGCQKRLDKRASSFGALDPSCVPAASRFAGGASGGITRSCGSFSGLDVGSCAQLPACLVDASAATGELLARGIYGALVCGNGELEFGEECDDGNADPGDGCTGACQLPACGDGFVQAGVEECDDGNDIATDRCNDCRLPVCGDGIVAEGTEECDDGNTTANDGCTDCEIDPLTCGAQGVDVTIDTDFDVFDARVAGLTLQVSYPGLISIPGSLGDPSVEARVTNLTTSGLFLVSDLDLAPTDGVDDTLRTVYANTTEISPGPFQVVRFDCQPGGVVRPRDFPCNVTDTSDPEGTAVLSPVDCFVSSIVAVGPPPTTTTLGPTTTTTVVGPTTTSSSTSTTTSTTSTTVPSLTCGDGTTDPNETCDDGNTLNGDVCPADCVIASCTPALGSSRLVDVSFTPPQGQDVAGLTVLVLYPEGRVSIPGLGSEAGQRISNLPSGAFASFNDLDYALRAPVASGGALAPGRLFTIDFLDCQSAAPPAAGEFPCVVEDAANGNGDPIAGVTCSVTIP